MILTTAALFCCILASTTGSAGCMLEKLEEASLLEADFEQVDYWALTRETEVFSGRLLLSKDGRFLLVYAEPDGKVLGYDGETLYTVDPLYRQVLLDTSSEPASFTALLESIGDPGRTSVARTSGDTLTVRMEGDIGQGIARMDFTFLLSDSLPRVLSTTDCNGNSSTWLLESVTVSSRDPGEAFSLDIPGGYEVLRAGDL